MHDYDGVCCVFKCGGEKDLVNQCMKVIIYIGEDSDGIVRQMDNYVKEGTGHAKQDKFNSYK